MAYPPLRFIARWAWLPLLALVLLLYGQLSGLRGDARSLERELSAADQRVAELRVQAARPAAPRRSVGGPPASEKKSPPTPRPAVSTDANALNDPDYGLIIARRQRRYAMGNYRAAIEALHLSKADEDRLKQLIAAEWNAGVDAADVVSHMANAPGDLRGKAEEAVRAESEQKIKELLGDEKYAAFKATYDERLANTGVWMLSTGMWDAGVPMTSDQETALKRAQYEVSSQFHLMGPGGENPVDPQTGLRQSDLALLEKVGTFLSPDQVAFIRNEKLLDARYRALVAEASRRKAAAGGGH